LPGQRRGRHRTNHRLEIPPEAAIGAGVRILLYTLAVFGSLAPGAAAEMREFTDAVGRKLKAEIIETGEGWIRVRRVDGHKFLLTFDKLSVEDKTWLEERAKKLAADAAAKKHAAELQAKIVAWCKSQVGKQVGNGECWTLANEAFNECGGQRPGEDLRVWGRKLDFPKETPQPGDIVEYRSATFANGSRTGPEHTAVVTGKTKKGLLVIAEQNWGGVKKVRETEFDPAGLQSGEMMFYRPE
jgi:hypothetical protein